MAITTIVRTSSLEFGNRLDAELYNPRLQESFKVLLGSDYPIAQLRQHCTIRSGTTPPDRKSGLTQGPILFKTTDVRNGIVPSRTSYFHISDAIHERMFKTRLQNCDVLLNIVGATLKVIGRSAFVYGLEGEANITQAMSLLRCKDDEILPGYLFAYLNTIFAQDQIARYARPTGQYNLNLPEVGHIYIPVLPEQVQREIQEAIISVAITQDRATTCYQDAKRRLDSCLNLDKLVLRRDLAYTAPLSSVQSSHRTDAQHFDPRYGQLLAHLSNYNPQPIRGIRTYNHRGTQPVYVAAGTVDVVNSQHIGPMHLDYYGFAKTSVGAFAAAPESRILENDILTYATGAYVGRTNVYLHQLPALASNHVNILRLKEGVDAAYMALVFQSLVGDIQTRIYARGTAQAELYSRDIDRFIVPLLDANEQAAIGDLVRQSLQLQEASHELLQRTKAHVTQAIGGNQQASMLELAPENWTDR